MLSALLMIFQATFAEAEQRAMDDNLILAVGQQIRDITAAIAASKRALALLIVQDKAEAARHAAILADIADLETRAMSALQGGRDDLAAQAAEAIASLEAERLAIEEDRSATAKEVADLRAAIHDAGARLANIERLRRIGAASEAVRRLKARSKASGLSVLGEAEANLRQLRKRQIEQADVDKVLDAIEAETSPRAVAGRLAAEGFGLPTKISGAEVLTRLRRQAGEAPTAVPLPAFHPLP